MQYSGHNELQAIRYLQQQMRKRVQFIFFIDMRQKNCNMQFLKLNLLQVYRLPYFLLNLAKN